VILIAVLDANILYSVATADPLIYAAEYGACSVVWSERIADEYTRSLVRDGFPVATVARRRLAMETALPDACLSDALIEPHLPAAAIIIRQARRHGCLLPIAGQCYANLATDHHRFPATLGWNPVTLSDCAASRGPQP